MAEDMIRIGMVEPFSGPMESYGRECLAAAQFAVDEQDAKGGLLGKKIQLLHEDNEFKPDVAVKRARKLVLEDKVNFITGSVGTPMAVALNHVATSYKTIMIQYSAAGDLIQGKEFSRYGFRISQNIYNLGASLAELMAVKPYKNYYEVQPDFVAGRETDALIKGILKTSAPQIKVVGTEYTPFGTNDFGPYLTKMMAAKPDALIVGLYGVELINFIKQARKMGFASPFPIFSMFALDPYVMQELKEDGVGVYTTWEYELRIKSPENQAMIKKFNEQHKNDKDFITWWPSSSLGNALLAWKMTFAAIEKADSLDPEKIIETLENFQWKGPAGQWTMRKCDHQVMLPMYGGVIEAGSNPFYPFPWIGAKLEVFPAEKVVVPATKDYNQRCP
jgi:branched-chain amino acid transport system substrate-binding protein